MAYSTMKKRADYQRKYYTEHRAEILKQQKLRRETVTGRNTTYHRKYKRRIKKEVMMHYGGGQCVCAICGETNLYCLSIDHINGRGNQERKTKRFIVWGGNIYGYLRKAHYPTGYQVLCMNCQFIKWAIQRGDVDWSLMSDIEDNSI